MHLFSSPKIFILLGALFALIAVSMGSFGAHYLKNRLAADALAIFEIGVRYQMYHALGLILIGIVYLLFPAFALIMGGYCLAVGILVFSGSLYALAYTGAKWWGAVTPIGGITLLIGWLFFLIGVCKGA
ncbi:DUF423 domain-containing protein [Parachlamydia sp. AcF125]|uniref:DUF423 domain-containing protein n=1 Tax=Parachlamydia sp. AcF125 TaxID=2795736 RepID=UPI001BCA1801|nr:DUF423 domain-containing protein [Parachlamydia sp. AcF125]MBS4168404.1 hypothetical protein [Parachlamydia sp. AcF125]